MKNTSLLRQVALLAFALGTAGLTATFAQTPDTTTPSTPPATTPPSTNNSTTLTADEKAQYQKAHDQVLADNPDLKAADDDLMKQRADLKSQGSNASASDKAALHTAMMDHRDKMRAAMLLLDPTLAPIFAKMDAMHAGH